MLVTEQIPQLAGRLTAGLEHGRPQGAQQTLLIPEVLGALAPLVKRRCRGIIVGPGHGFAAAPVGLADAAGNGRKALFVELPTAAALVGFLQNPADRLQAAVQILLVVRHLAAPAHQAVPDPACEVRVQGRAEVRGEIIQGFNQGLRIAHVG
ncbi:MAG: hypothetical protein U5Q16_07625 [Gammaproteobacteria bacterium]|nr:hypothetical protein [Gammaproteobacteria bacterium]